MTSPAADPKPFPAGMLSEAEARARILARITPLPTETVALIDALDRFAAAAQFATQGLPAFDNSSMDGYALGLPGATRTAQHGDSFVVTGEQAAGPDLGLRVDPGQAIRIFTGAPVPAGTGAVVMQEDVTRTADRLVIQTSVEPGENVRRAGSDLARGQKLFERGDRLTAARLALLASQGLADTTVCRRPRVAILATGDELRPAGQPLGPGEIYESNGILLATLARSLGARVTLLERARDTAVDLDAKLLPALLDHDALVVAGGVSVGERDLVKGRLAAAGVRLDLWRVRVQPGKPFLYGRRIPPADGPKGAHVFGLPGNPVSAFITFLLFVRPALLRLVGAGEGQLNLPEVPGTAAVELTNRGERPHYLRGTLDAANRFTPTGPQESHALFALSRSSALARVEPQSVVPAGGTVAVLSF